MKANLPSPAPRPPEPPSSSVEVEAMQEASESTRGFDRMSEARCCGLSDEEKKSDDAER